MTSSETPSQSSKTPNQVKIVFGVLSTYERSGWIHPSILQFFCDLPFVKGVAFRVIPVHNFIPAAAGRNVLCQNLKDSDADWICMLDNDMHVNGDLLKTVENAPADADIIAPAFYMWNQADLKLTLCWGMDGAPEGIKKLTPGFHELTKCGTGAIFIKPHVFKTMEYPYFRYLYNGDAGMQGTEDIQFCLSAREKGFKIYGNADVVVGHYRSVELSQMWKWAEQSYKTTLDAETRAGVDSASKDSGCSPEPAQDGVPVEAT